MAIRISGTTGIDMGNAPVSNASQIDGVVVNENNENVATTSNLVGFKNYIINGNFDIWQRGNGPFTNFKYGADRWVSYHASATMKSSITSSNGIQKRIAHIQNVTAGYYFLAQPIELPLTGFGHPFTVGKKFTVSVRYSSSTKIRPNLVFRDSGAGANPVDLDSSMTAPVYKGGSGVDEVVSWTFTVDGTAASTNTCLVLVLQAESNASDVYMYQVQLEEGSVATPFEQRPYGLELSLCQRYYCKSFGVTFTPSNADSSTTVNDIYNAITTLAPHRGRLVSNVNTCSIPFGVEMRIAPTVHRYGNSSGYWFYNDGITAEFTPSMFVEATTKGLVINNEISTAFNVIAVGPYTADAEL